MFFNQKRKKGFTLVELLVSMFVFSLLAGGIIGIFTSSIQSQKKILGDQRAISELSYVMEYISKALRMAVRDNDGSCIFSGGYNYQLIGGGDYNSRIRFLNNKNECQEYYLENNKIYERKSEDENDNFGVAIPLTSSRTYIDHIYFHKAGSGWDSGSVNQPKVMINLKFRSIDDDDDDDASIFFQTTVSQRNINSN